MISAGEFTVERDIADGERLLVHVGHVGSWTRQIQFDIQLVPGFLKSQEATMLLWMIALIMASIVVPVTAEADQIPR